MNSAVLSRCRRPFASRAHPPRPPLHLSRARLLELEQTVAHRTAAAGSQIQNVKSMLAQLLQAGTGSSPTREQLRQVAQAAAEAERLLCNNGAAGPVATAAAADPGRAELQEEVQRLRAELATARQKPLAEAGRSLQPARGPSVEAAVEELQAVLPQYRATAAKLQGHAAVLQKQLAAAASERDQLKEQAGAWRAAARRASMAACRAACAAAEAATWAARRAVGSLAARAEARAGTGQAAGRRVYRAMLLASERAR